MAELLNVFYRGDYPVFAGQLQEKYLGRDSRGLDLLARRPGLFARALFAWALRVGPEEAFAAFAGVMSHIPARLLYTLNTFAENYFVLDTPRRTVVPGRGFAPVEVPANPGLRQYSLEQRAEIAAAVKSLFLREMSRRYATLPHSGTPVYIAPALFDIPLPVGDRSNAVADFGALMPGQKFKVEGNELRVFLQWGNGLPAQHLDMDLSAAIIYDSRTELCAYFRLNTPGAVHSGDIRHIPDQIGTAEYIEIDCARLRSLGARYVVFTGNGYSTPNLSPNLAFGWMSSAFPMSVDDSTGVAYDPAHVQHLAHLPDSVISQGMAFAILDLRDMFITVIDLPFKGRTVERLSISAVEASLRRLRAKPTVGELLALMAEATGRPRTDSPQPGCEIFDFDFISDPDRAAKLLLP